MGRRKSENSVYRNLIERDMLIIYWKKKGLINCKIAIKLGINRMIVTAALEKYPSAGFAKNNGTGKFRPCLQCSKDFEQDKNHTWICPRCQTKYAGSDPPLFEGRDAGNLAKKIRAMRESGPKRKWPWLDYMKSAADKGPEGKRIKKLGKKLRKL